MRLTDKHDRTEAQSWASSVALQIIRQMYARWRYGLPEKKKEPAITVGWMVDYLDQYGGKPSWYYWAMRSQRYNLVRGVLEALEKEGHLVVSTGLNEQGREARCYEPKEQD